MRGREGKCHDIQSVIGFYLKIILQKNSRYENRIIRLHTIVQDLGKRESSKQSQNIKSASTQKYIFKIFVINRITK